MTRSNNAAKPEFGAGDRPRPRGYHVALITAFPPGKNSLNEYGYHLAINFAQNPNTGRISIYGDRLDEAQDAFELPLDPKIQIARNWRFNGIFSLFHILRALYRDKPDLALFNVQMASFGDREIPAALGLLTPWLARLMGQKSGIIAHNMIMAIDLEDTLLKGQWLRQKLVRAGGAVIAFAMMRASYITVTLESYYEFYRRKFPKARLYHIAHGSFESAPSATTPYKKRGPIIVTMGKFGTYKRLETLISALAILRADKRHKDLRLIIGGTDHPNRAGYMAGLERAHKDDAHITFHGYVAEEDIAGFFDQARISVFDYSSTTGSSGVLHQAVCYGAVPVFPAIGDFVDVAKSEGIRGENYEPDNAEDMAEAIARVLNDENHAEALSENNIEAASELPFSEIIDFHLKQIEI